MKKFFTLLTGILLLSLNFPAFANLNVALGSGFSASDSSKFIFHENFDSPAFPPPGYTSNIISGLGNWVWSDQGEFPEAFPQDGNGLITYESFLWDAGSSAVLITPQINVPDATYRIRFAMYRDASSPAALDRLEVLANDKNNNVNTATTLGVVHRHIAASPAVSEEGWYYFDFPVSVSGNVFFFFKAISQNGANIHLDAFFIELVPLGQPSLGVIPAAIDFGPVPVGYEPDSEQVKLWNIGDGILTINQGDINITGPDADAFSISGGVFPIQLQKYQSFALQMNFTSASAGAKSANLTISHNGSNSPTSAAIAAECYNPLANFFENFDDVMAPFLPPIWNKIVQSTSDNAFVGTFVDATPASSPNHVRMFNSSDNAAQLFLVTPAVSGFAGNWLGFKAKTFSSNQLLKIGTLADPRNPETFEEIDRVIVPAGAYTQFYIPFTDYAGSNQFLAFLHGLGGTNRSIYIDDVVWEAMPVDPVFSVSPASNDFGPVLIGTTSALQSFTIRNLGGGKLIINPADITLAGLDASDFILYNLETSVELTYNQTATFSVSFAPGSQGTKQASIFINDNISDIPHEIPLSGFAFSNVVTDFPWTETFEDYSSTRPAWTQIREVGSAFWTFAAGSTSSIGGGNITTAYAGDLNARFVSVVGTNTPITKLITPFLDLTGIPNPGIVFYLGQQSLSDFQNETKVYYRTSATDPWVQLAHYTENIAEWTRKYLALPNPGSTYQVAFEGINNRGRANVLDEVSVCPELLPVSVGITADLNEVCEGTMVTFTATHTNAGETPHFQWKVNGNNSGSNSPVFSYIPAIGDQVGLLLTSGEECVINKVAESNIINMEVFPVLPVSVTISADQTEVCEGATVTLTASPVNGGQNPSFQWKLNGEDTGPNSPVFSFTPANSDQVAVVLSSSEICTSGNPATSDPVSLIVAPLMPVSVSIEASQSEVCQGSQVTFTAIPFNGGTVPHYQWKVNGANAGLNSSTFSYTPNNGDEVYVVLTSNSACATGNPATSNIIGMIVHPLLPVSVSIEADQTDVCQGTIVTFTATPVNGGVNPHYQWQVNGSNFGSNTQVLSYAPAHGDQVTVILTSSAVCPSENPATSNPVYMVVNPLLPVNISITASENNVCAGTPVTFSATPVNGGLSPTYQWKVNGNNVGSSTLQYTYTPADDDQVLVVLTSSEACATGNPATSNIIAMMVNPLLPVSVSITASENNVCAGAPVTFTAAPVNGGFNPTYQWKVNGSNVGTSTSQYTYTPADGDQVSVVLTSSEACATSSPATSNVIAMTVNPLLPVSVSISASENNVCAGTPVTFTAAAVNGGLSPTYQWKVNGSNVGGNAPHYTYAPVSGDQVSVVLISSEACATGSPATGNTITMTVNPLLPVSVSITADETEVCQGVFVTFTASPVNGGSSPTYQWKVNGINAGNNSRTFVFAPVNGDQVSVVMTSNATCATGNPTTSNIITIIVNPLLPVGVSISADQTQVCSGTPVTFTATPVNGGINPLYQWKVNGANAGTNSPLFTYTPSHNDQVSVVLSSSEECATNNPATSNFVGITVFPLLPVSVSITSSESNVCAGTAVTFTATPVNGGLNPVYQWKVNGSNAGTNSANFTYIPLDGDQVSVVLTSSEFCVTGNPATSNIVTMTVNPLLPVSVSIAASENNVCSGTVVTFTATPVNGGSSPGYQWKVNGSNAGSNSPNFTYIPVDGDQVQGVLTSSETCVSGNPANSNLIAMTVFANPVVTWNWTPEPVYPWDDPVVLSGGMPAGGQYSGTGVSDNIFYPLVAGPGTHVLTYTFVNLNGCSGTATATIVVLEAPDCNAPTNLMAGNITLNSAQLSWTAGNVEQEWQLEWGPSGFAHGSGTLVSGLTNAQYSLSGLAEATAYQFYVRAVCGGGVTSGWAGPYSFSTLFNLVCPENISVCELEIPFTLGGGIPAGGTYTGPGIIDGLFDPALAGAGTHTITYTYQGESCQFTITVQQALPVSVSITSSESNVCAGTAVTFTATPVNGGLNPVYQWKVNGSNAGTNSANFTYIPLDGDQVSVVLTSSEFCVTGNPATSNIVTMTVNPLLPVSVSIAASENNVCSGTVVTFTATPVNGGSSPGYQWKVNGSNAGSNSPNFTYIPVDGDQVQGVLTSSETCVSGNPANSNLIAMTVFANPVVTWNWTPEPVYPWDDPVVLSGGMPAGGQYSGTGVSDNIFYPLVAGPGTHVLTYTFVNLNGCSGTATATIVVLEAPDCNAPTNLMAGNITLNSAQLSWTAGNVEQEWQLEWGPSGFAHGSGTLVSGLTNAQYSLSGLAEATAYQFYVRAVCGGGVTSGWAGPYSFSTLFNLVCPENISVCELEIPFTLGGGIPAGGTYTGPGIIDGLFDPALAGAGTHTITYTYQGESCQFTITVQQALPVSVSITANENNVCLGTSVTFTATVVNGGLSPTYQWKVNGSNAGTNSANFTYIPLDGDQVSVVLTSSELCATGNPATSNAITIMVNPLLAVSVSITASENNVCSGTPVTFTAMAVNGGSSPSYQWKVNGANAGANSPQFTYNPLHGDQVQVVLTSSETCVSGNPANSNLLVMTVYANPIVTWPWTHDPVSLTDDPILLTGGMPSGGQYSGPGVTGNIFYPLVAGPGVHLLTYTYVNTFGCAGTSTALVEVLETPDCVAPTDLAASEVTTISALLSWVAGYTEQEWQLEWGLPGFAHGSGNLVSGLTAMQYSLSGLEEATSYQFFVRAVCTDGITSGWAGPLQFTTLQTQIEIICPADLTVCENEPAFMLTGASPAGGNYSGTGVSANLFDPALAGAGIHTITYTFNGESCSFLMTVQPALAVSVSINADQTEVCQGTLVTFTATFVNGGSHPSFEWRLNGMNAGTDSPLFSYVPSHDDQVFVLMNSSETCATNNPASSNIIILTVFDSPLVTWDWDPDPFNFDSEPIILTGGLPTGGQYSGSGVIDNTFYPQLAGPGLHVLTYTFVDMNGCGGSVNNSIEVLESPDCSAPTSLLASEITIDSALLSWMQGSNHEEWTLEWGPSGFAPGEGTLVAGLLVPEYSLSGLTEETSYDFYVKALCTAGITSAWAGPLSFTTLSSQVEIICPDDILVCIAAEAFELTGASPEGGVYVGAGVSGTTFDPELAGEGTHTITYTFENQSCEFMITVEPLVEASVTINAQQDGLCHGSAITFLATPVNGGTDPVYQWLVNGVHAGANSTEFTYLPSNGDQVNVIMTSSESCVTENPVSSNIINVNLQPNLPVSVHIIGGVTEVCEGIMIYFFAFPVNGGTQPTYQWLLNDTPFGLNSPVLSFIPADGDRVKVVLTSSETCTSGNPATSNEFVISVNPRPVVMWDWDFETVCLQTPSIPLNGVSPEGGIFSGPGIKDGLFLPPAAGPGLHTLSYIYFDEEGCYNIAKVEILVDECTGVTELVQPGQILLYPNPARYEINLIPGPDFRQLKEIIVFDMHGNLLVVKESPEPREVYVLDIRHLPRGVYFVIVRGSKGILRSKFVVM